MIIKTLKPIRDRIKYADELTRLLSVELYHLIYKPLIDLLTYADVRHNDKPQSILTEAFTIRAIYYQDGFIFGKLNARISKALTDLGAKFNKTRKAFKIDLGKFSPEIRAAMAKGQTAERDAVQKLAKKTRELASKNVVIPGIEGISKSTLEDLHEQFKKVTPEDLGIPIEMTEATRERIRQDYTQNVYEEIDGFSKKAIDRVRARVVEEVGQGTRADQLRKILLSEYNVTANHAKFIARQETSLFVAKFRKTRYEDAGINEYRWSTSRDERVRDSHKELNNRIFRWDDPPIVDKATGRRANPGEDFNCLPEDSQIDLAYGIKKCFRRWYNGKLTEIVTESGKTPNHQVLTSCGWKAIGLLNNGDYLVDLGEQLRRPFTDNVNNGVTFIGEIFDSFAKDFTMLTRKSIAGDFHGDRADSDVDIIDTASRLVFWRKFGVFQSLQKFFFSGTNAFAFCQGYFSMGHYFSPSRYTFMGNTGMSSKFLAFRNSGDLKPLDISLRNCANSDSRINKFTVDSRARKSGFLANFRLSFSRKIRFNDWAWVKKLAIPGFSSFPSVGFDADRPKSIRQNVRMKADDLRGLHNRLSGVKKFDCVVKISVRNFSGHVFNLETVNNWFASNGILYHNCRCVALPVIKVAGKDILAMEELGEGAYGNLQSKE